MAGSIAVGFLLEALAQLVGEVYTRLVGQAEQHPEHIGHLLA